MTTTTMRRANRVCIGIVIAILVTLATQPAMAGNSTSRTISYNPALQLETTTPVKHFITMMQSNHSFDSLFGTYPGANGIPDNVCMKADPTDRFNEECVEPFALSNNGADFDHSHGTFQNQYRDGKNDGFLYCFRLRGEDGTLAMGHYTETDLPFSYNAADEYVLFDRFFTSASAGSVPNRMYWTTGTAGISNFEASDIPAGGWGNLPTIFDLLEESGISWKFYIENYDPSLDFRNRGTGGTYAQVNWAPVLNYARYVDDPEFSSHIVDLDEYFVDAANDELPAVAYVVPVGSSGHPPGSMLASERLLSRMTNALMMSPAWSTSVFQWAYDDWGGWYDHVVPPQVDEFGYGFRTAAQLISPYAKPGYIDSETHDFTSILRFIEDNWSLPALANRDKEAVSIATALDFDQEANQPQILGMTRGEESTIVIPNRTAIHITYSVAISSAGLIILASLIGSERRKRKGRIR